MSWMSNVQALLKEYLVSGDYTEAAGCLRTLDVPHYHHEFVKRALLAAFEKPDQASTLLSLLSKLTGTGQISQVWYLVMQKVCSKFMDSFRGLWMVSSQPCLLCCTHLLCWQACTVSRRRHSLCSFPSFLAINTSNRPCAGRTVPFGPLRLFLQLHSSATCSKIV